MICLIQRVNDAEVKIKDISYSKIEKGLLIFLGIEKDDGNEDLDYIVKKTLGLRIFSDQKNKMNLSVQDIKGQILIVSQFLIFAPLFVLQFQHISWLDRLKLGAIFISGSLWLQVIGLVMSEHIYQRIFPRKSPKMFILGIIISLIVLPAISPVSWSRLLSPIYVLVRSLIDVSNETGLTSSAIGIYIIGYFLFSLVHFFLKEVP